MSKRDGINVRSLLVHLQVAFLGNNIYMVARDGIP